MESPCRNLCHLDEHQVCTGCGRSLYEITHWIDMSDAQRAEVMQRLASDDIGILAVPLSS